MKHHARGSLDDEPVVKRRCIQHRWSDFGSSVKGGLVAAGGNGAGDRPNQTHLPRQIILHEGSLLICDKMNSRVLRWPLGSTSGVSIAGQGAPINGINSFGRWFSIALATNGELLVADMIGNHILRFSDSQGWVVGDNQWELRRPKAVCCTSQDAVYVLDDGNGGQRVQRLEGGVSSIVGNE